jgi:threonine 3-dehydrogenase
MITSNPSLKYMPGARVNEESRTCSFSGPAEWDVVNNVIYKEANGYGVTGRIMWDTWWLAQSILLSGKIAISPVITHTFGLKDFDRALQLAESATIGKIVFQL